MEDGEEKVPASLPYTSRPCITTPLKVLKYEVNANPKMSAYEIRYSYPTLVGGVSVYIVQHKLCDDRISELRGLKETLCNCEECQGPGPVL